VLWIALVGIALSILYAWRSGLHALQSKND
jgi:hypothetical protein